MLRIQQTPIKLKTPHAYLYKMRKKLIIQLFSVATISGVYLICIVFHCFIGGLLQSIVYAQFSVKIQTLIKHALSLSFEKLSKNIKTVEDWQIAFAVCIYTNIMLN